MIETETATTKTVVSLVKLSLVQEGRAEYPNRITAPEAAAEIVQGLTKNDADESFYVLALNVKNQVNHIYLAAKGGGEGVSLSMKDIFRAALVANASGIIVAHNHPSGDLTPSQEDQALTRRVRECCSLLGLRFLDSIIVSASGYHSILA